MRTIRWELPFKNMHYLNSLTEDIVDNPYVILITGIQTEDGSIDKCQISIREEEGNNMDDVIFNLGASIGAHSVIYAQRMIEIQEEVEEAKVAFFGTLGDVIQEIAAAVEQNEEEAPKGEDFKPKAELTIVKSDKELEEVEIKVEGKVTLGIEEKIEEIEVEEVEETTFRKLLRIILLRYKK